MMRRVMLCFALGIPILCAWAVPASADSIVATPSAVPVSGTVTVSGDVLTNGQPGCGLPGTVTLISNAFVGHGEFAGEGAVFVPVGTSGHFSQAIVIKPGVAAGTYTITGRCGGGNLGVVSRLTVTGLPRTGASFGPLSDTEAGTLGIVVVVAGAAITRLARRRQPMQAADRRSG